MSVISLIAKMALKGTKFYGVEPELDGVRDLGLYVHVPFCKYLCPYCPYTREVYKKEKAERYTEDVKKEIDICQRLMGREKNITSFYFGGGTPSTNVGELIKIIEHARERFEIDGDVAIEANPDDLNEENLGKMWDNGIKKLSIGIQSFDDLTLKRIGRFSHDGKTAEESIVLARDVGFRDLNVDLMFNLPGQSLGELEQDLKKAIEMGAGQITTYPLILFPYTEMGEDAKDKRIKIDKANEKRMYGAALEFFKSSHYKQINVWSFSERGIDRYGSVERDDYIGIGAGAISLLPLQTYSNTFSVEEYSKSLANGELPVAFGSNFSKRDAMVQWFMLRLYELRISQDEFKKRFDAEIDKELRAIINGFKLLGIIEENGREITVKKPAAVHELTKAFLENYISRIQQKGLEEPWPVRFEI